MWNVKIDPPSPNIMLENESGLFDTGISIEKIKDIKDLSEVLVGESEDNFCMLKIGDIEVKTNVIFKDSSNSEVLEESEEVIEKDDENES